MGILLTILVVIVSLIVLLLIIGLFVKKDYGVNREIVIDKPIQQVFDYVRMQKNQELYNKWVMTDPEKKIQTHGIDGTIGFIYAWNGNKRAGEGEVEILRIRENEQVETEVRFIRPFPSSALITMNTSALSGNQTLLKWGFSSRMKYPMNLMLVLIGMEKMLGKDMEISLGNLKQILEN